MDEDKVVRVLQVTGLITKNSLPMNYYRRIDRNKVQFDFLLHKESDCADEISSMGGNVYVMPRRFPNYPKHLRWLNEFFKNNRRYDVVHQNTGNSLAISVSMYAKKHGAKKRIYHSHGSKSDRSIIGAVHDVFYKKKISKYATHYFACSDMAADHVFGKYIDKSEIKIINNGVDTEVFGFNTHVREKKRQELGIDDKFVIGHVGRLSPEKNHQFIVAFFSEIYNRNKDAVLLLVGDGKLRGTIEKNVRELGLEHKVIFAGDCLDVAEYLCAMDVFVFPSLYEGLPLALVEAQANGLHCLASDNISRQAAITDLLEYLPLTESAMIWADRILSFADGYERKDMRGAIKRAGFDITEVVNWLEEFYTD